MGTRLFQANLTKKIRCVWCTSAHNTWQSTVDRPFPWNRIVFSLIFVWNLWYTSIYAPWNWRQKTATYFTWEQDFPADPTLKFWCVLCASACNTRRSTVPISNKCYMIVYCCNRNELFPFIPWNFVNFNITITRHNIVVDISFKKLNFKNLTKIVLVLTMNGQMIWQNS